MGSTVKVAIVGVGNCASALVQGVHYYREADPAERVPGLMHVDLGGYHVGDVEFVAAFDVDAKKVGRDLAEAIVAPPNNTYQFAEVPPVGVDVLRGPTLDGFGEYYRTVSEEADAEPVDVAEELRRSGADVLVCYLPVWAERFTAAGVPIIGDDIKSQVGATITHRILTRLFEDRGVHLDRTYQLNFGGNMDFMNMLERDRLSSKKVSKTQSVTSQMTEPVPAGNIHVGPSDHVPWLEDRKWAYIRMEGRNFGDVPLNMELKLEVWDSPNSAGVVIDAVRCAKIAMDRGLGGPLHGPSSYFMKSPPAQFPDDVCREMVESFIAEDADDRAAESLFTR